MAIYFEPPLPTIRTQPPTGFPKLDRGLHAFGVLYDGLAAPQAAEHIQRVLGVSIRSRIIEPARFADGRQPPEINERLLYIIGCHLLNCRGVEHSPYLPEQARKYRRIHDGLKTFFLLRELDLKRASLEEYAGILKDPPEALLARLADVGEYHNPNWRDNTAGLRHAHLFKADIDMNEEQVMIARIGRLLYAPLADFLGYRSLAGEILETTAITLFPETLNEVYTSLSAMGERLRTTRRLVQGIARKIQDFCEREGVDVEIIFRPEKNRGKIVEKLRYYRSMNGEGRPAFSVSELSDLEAFKIVVKGMNGKKLPSEEDKIRLAYAIESFINNEIARVHISEFLPGCELGSFGGTSLKMLGMRIRQQDYFRTRKKNNYRAIHLDFIIPGDLQGMFANFEIQIITEEGDFWARRGGAAHFAYHAERYGGTNELRVFNATWAQMMDALRTGREDVVAKYLVPSVPLATIRVTASYPNGTAIADKIVGIPANRIVADALIRAGVSGFADCGITINNGVGHKLETRLDGIRSLEVMLRPGRGPSPAYLRTLLSKCGEVETAVFLASAIRSH